tara:strand:+ start:828 stop:1073 length:246 start_codon:yes stop_codon:yes gene_type:complete
MNSYKNASRYRDIYVDPIILGGSWHDVIIGEIDNYDDWGPEDDEIYAEEVSTALAVLLKDDLVDVYWTEDNRFYLEDNTRR